MCGDVAEPLNLGVSQCNIGVEALCDEMRNERRALLVKEVDQPFLFLHEHIDSSRLLSREINDSVLFNQGRDRG
jgi:hypothetical protein